MSTYSEEAKPLIEEKRSISTELAAITFNWQQARAKGSDPGLIRSFTARIAGLNQRLSQLDAALSTFEVSR